MLLRQRGPHVHFEREVGVVEVEAAGDTDDTWLERADEGVDDAGRWVGRQAKSFWSWATGG